MIRFELEGRRMGALPGAYKGKRKRREPPVWAFCLEAPCKWKVRRKTAEEARAAMDRHLAAKHWKE